MLKLQAQAHVARTNALRITLNCHNIMSWIVGSNYLLVTEDQDNSCILSMLVFCG
jgi:hypothetical protein